MLFLLLFPLSCEKEDNSFKWRDEWNKQEEDDPDPEPFNPDIKGGSRYIWIDAAANFQYYANDAE